MKLLEAATAVEPRHRWAAVGSVALHLLAALVLSIQPAAVPEPEPVVEVMLEPPLPEKKRVKQRLAKKPAKPKKQPIQREPHTLTARWQTEKKPPRDLPQAVQLPEAPENLPVDVAAKRPAAAASATASAATGVAAVAKAEASTRPEPVAAPQTLPQGSEQPARVAPVAGEAGGDLSLPGSAAGRAEASAGAEGQGLLTDRLSGSRAPQESQGNAAWSQTARAAASPDDLRGTGLATAAAPTAANDAQEKAAAGGIASALASRSSATPAAGNETALPQLLRTAGGGARGAASREGGQAAGQAAAARTQASAKAVPGEGGFSIVTESGQQTAPGSGKLVKASPQARPQVVLIGSGGAPTGPAYALVASTPLRVTPSMRFERALAPAQAGSTAVAPVVVAGMGAPAASAAPVRAQAVVALPGDGQAYALAPVEARMAQSITPGNGGRLATQLAGTGKADAALTEAAGAGLATATQNGKAATPVASALPGGGDATGAGANRASAEAVGAGKGGGTQIAAASQQARLKGEDACLPGVEADAPNMLCHIPQTRVQPVAMAANVPGVDHQPGYAQGNPPLLFSPIVPGGRVMLRVHVLKDGSPDKVLVKESSGSRLLDDETVNQIWRWRFNPAKKAGQPVDAWVDLPVSYRKPRFGG